MVRVKAFVSECLCSVRRRTLRSNPTAASSQERGCVGGRTKGTIGEMAATSHDVQLQASSRSQLGMTYTISLSLEMDVFWTHELGAGDGRNPRLNGRLSSWMREVRKIDVWLGRRAMLTVVRCPHLKQGSLLDQSGVIPPIAHV